MKKVVLLVSHLAMAVVGFVAGIYTLPILTATPPPTEQLVKSVSSAPVLLKGQFSRDRADSDTFHWGEGEIMLTVDKILFQGELAPGPDYRLYLSDTFIETEAEFMAKKDTLLHVGHINSFNGFVLDMPDVPAGKYNAAIIWCESFGEFISSARLSRGE